MKNKDNLTNMTVVIDKDLKHAAKIKAVINNLTLKEYIAKIIKEDIEKGE